MVSSVVPSWHSMDAIQKLKIPKSSEFFFIFFLFDQTLRWAGISICHANETTGDSFHLHWEIGNENHEFKMIHNWNAYPFGKASMTTRLIYTSFTSINIWNWFGNQSVRFGKRHHLQSMWHTFISEMFLFFSFIFFSFLFFLSDNWTIWIGKQW